LSALLGYLIGGSYRQITAAATERLRWVEETPNTTVAFDAIVGGQSEIWEISFGGS